LRQQSARVWLHLALICIDRERVASRRERAGSSGSADYSTRAEARVDRVSLCGRRY
jgi:hypothetical protein